MKNVGDSLRIRYIAGLTSIALLTLITQFVVQIQITRQQTDANVINIAGRQRMLSQQITKEALQLQSDIDSPILLSALESTLTLWEIAHEGLQNGSEVLNLPGENSKIVTRMYEIIARDFQEIARAASCLLNLELPDCGTINQNIAIILEHENDFLQGMDQIVFQYTYEAETEIQHLQMVEIALASLTIIALIMEAFFIFRPAEVHIRHAFKKLEQAQKDLEASNNELENRVAERTRQLSQINLQLKESNDDLVAFSQVLAHDLKSPLALAKGFTNELNMDWQTVSTALTSADLDDNSDLDYIIKESMPDAIKSLQLSVQQMEHLMSLISKLSLEDRRELAMEHLNTRQVVDEILRLYEQVIQNKKITITVGDLPDVQADLVSIERTFSNLIDNAIKYTDPSQNNTIKIYAKETDDRVTYYVEDTGRGIAGDDFEKVFQIFGRAGDPKHTEGEGIGLYAVRNLVRRHGGSIGFESIIDQGSRFYFTIPKNLSAVSDATES